MVATIKRKVTQDKAMTIQSFDALDDMFAEIGRRQAALKPDITAAQRAMGVGDCYVQFAYDELIFGKILKVYPYTEQEDGEEPYTVDFDNCEDYRLVEAGSVMNYGDTEVGDCHIVEMAYKISEELYLEAKAVGFAVKDNKDCIPLAIRIKAEAVDLRK